MAVTTSLPVTMTTQLPVQDRVGPTVYVMMDKHSTRNTFANKTAKGLSIAQITLGVISFVCQVLLIILSNTNPSGFYEHMAGIGEGIYCGIFFILAGCLGLLACRKSSTCSITAFMTLSIIASIFSAAQIILSSFNLLGVTISRGYYYDDYYREGTAARSAKIGLFGAMILAGLAEGVLAIVSSAVCCRACCCQGGTRQGQVVYLPQGQLPLAQGHLPLAQGHLPLAQGQLPQAPIGETTVERVVVPEAVTESDLPSYKEIVQEKLQVKLSHKSTSGGYARF